MSKADDIIEARCRGASLDDIYSSLRSDIPLVGVEHRDSLKVVNDLLNQKVEEITTAVSEYAYGDIREGAKTLHEIAEMLESVCDEIATRGNGDGS